MKLEVKDLCFSYGAKPLLKDICFTANEGEIISVLGPNGVGKSTLFKCLLGFLKVNSGKVEIDGKDIKTMTGRELSSYIAYIPQNFNPVFNHSVLDCVLMGLTNQLGLFEDPKKEHEKKAIAVLKQLGIDNLAYQGCMKISGGERSLMLIARALVQNAKIIIMDEPTANLDFANSFKVMDIIGKLREDGYSFIISTHDPNQAIKNSTRVIALKDGEILKDASPDKIDEKILSKLYDVKISRASYFSAEAGL